MMVLGIALVLLAVTLAGIAVIDSVTLKAKP